MDEIHPPICSLPLHHGFFAREAPDRAHILQGLAGKKVAGWSPPKYANNRLLIPKYLGTQFFLIGDFMVKSIEISIFSGSITNFVSTPDTTPKSSPNNRRNLRRDAVQCC